MGQGGDGKVCANERVAAMSEAIAHAEKIIQSGHARDVRALGCPLCGASVRVTFVPGRKATVAGRCTVCRWVVFLDGVPKAPPWVAECGTGIETRAVDGD